MLRVLFLLFCSSPGQSNKLLKSIGNSSVVSECRKGCETRQKRNRPEHSTSLFPVKCWMLIIYVQYWRKLMPRKINLENEFHIYLVSLGCGHFSEMIKNGAKALHQNKKLQGKKLWKFL